MRRAILFILVMLSGCGIHPGKKKVSDQKKAISVVPLSWQCEGVPVHLLQMEGELVSIGVFVRGGMTNYNQKVQGIEYLALKSAIEGGTLLQEPEEWNKRSELLGIHSRINSSWDHSAVIWTFPKWTFTQSWNHCMQLLIAPAFRNEKFSELKNTLWEKAVQAEKLGRMSAMIKEGESAWMENDFARIPEGTSTSMLNFGRMETMEYFDAIFEKGRVFVVAAGDIDSSAINEGIRQSFSGLPSGNGPRNTIVQRFASGKWKVPADGSPVSRILIPATGFSPKEILEMDFCLGILSHYLRTAAGCEVRVEFVPVKSPFFLFQISGAGTASALREWNQLVARVLSEGFSLAESDRHYRHWRNRKWLLLDDPGEWVAWIGSGESMAEYGFSLQQAWIEFQQPDPGSMTQTFRKGFRDIAITFAGDTNAIDLGPLILNSGK